MLEREHWHVQRVPAWISQLQRHVVVPLAVQEVLHPGRRDDWQQSVERGQHAQTSKHHPYDAASSHGYSNLRFPAAPA